MSGREQGRRRKDARVYSTYDALVCTQFFFFEKRKEPRRRPTTYFVISQFQEVKGKKKHNKCNDYFSLFINYKNK
jgi:hypothetical protein